MKTPIKPGLLLSFGILLALTGARAGAETAAPPATTPTPPPAQDLPLDDLRTFAEVFGRIKADYVEGVQDKALIENAIRGMLSGLDPHSSYLDSEEYRELQVGTKGEFGGLGIEVGQEDGFVKVIAPIDDTPAQRAGLQAGDTIVRIDEKPVKGMNLDDAVKLMRGQPGTKIQLTILRGTDKPPFEVTLERAVIQVASVKSRTLEPGYAYVRLSQFQSHTAEDMLKAIDELKKANDGNLKGLVLDLRNNPGGVLNGAVGVSDAFLTDGLIVYTQGRIKDSRMQFKAGPDDVLNGAPIVVLVNSGSASASEIVAGALQDHKRALVMGSQTFGKGSVQTIVPIDDSRALKLTTARYYTPLGRSIQAQGITPDIMLERGEFKPLAEQNLNALKEANLVRHLSEGAPPEPEAKDKENEKDKKPPLAAEDFQLFEALNMLKGLNRLGLRGNQ
ncbi:S41 family peptidase [Thiobaca trueperi]|uniref:Carboxyl-terminal processing protease n=1 Tax=Thiobaca trueperi TaxID=127458 RepID=A0A4R3MV33_9GAMM|nr:S41 family peptidase [Thiobaca trueperi]TCT20184.1 carboxyl-terminal processing protease [Thiobaca trueperi]